MPKAASWQKRRETYLRSTGRTRQLLMEGYLQSLRLVPERTRASASIATVPSAGGGTERTGESGGFEKLKTGRVPNKQKMTMEIYSSGTADVVIQPMDGQVPLMTLEPTKRRRAPFLIEADAVRFLPNASIEVIAVTVSDSPRGPVYSETAMEWEKGK